ncbi:MAG: FecR domain-containing protein [Mucilaginibacter sp.]|uniref:FecR family protein n=1 Tax=Mucilaginibacter sp. TaxID=1882438 RepID=UPI00326407BC
MNYQKHSVEDFLCDNSFLEYCLGTNEASVTFWTDWLARHPEKLPAANSARALYYTLNGNITAENFKQDHQIFRQVVESADLSVKKAVDRVEVLTPVFDQKSYQRIGTIISGIAATILVATGFFFFKTNRLKTATTAQTVAYNIPLGHRRTIKLSDGSTVSLNGGSTLKVLKGFNIKTREVYLSGEGYFIIAHNQAKPFMVHTEKINVKDIGTEFNIKAYPADRVTEASLIKGLVEITLNKSVQSNKAGKAIILSPDKKFILDNYAMEHLINEKKNAAVFSIGQITKNVETNSVVETDWTQNKLTFFDEPLSDVALQMERWYGVKVIITNPTLKAMRFTGTFDHGEITHVLEALKLSGNFNYRKEDTVISIY